MITDQQYRRLRELIQKENTLQQAADKAAMDEKTARKYLRVGKAPSQCRVEHAWRTRKDPFEETWETIRPMLELNPGLEAKTIFEALQREQPGTYEEGQLRTLQRRMKVWRATEGPGQEVMFAQIHYPGQISASDFTEMSSMGITIAKTTFKHLIYHFVLTYSNWETGTICFSESYESLSEGLQNAFWELGFVPARHRTDCLTAAVNQACNPEVFTRHYAALLNHYGVKGEKIQPGEPHENGDSEQSHHRFKKAVEQSLMLRGSRNFENRSEYEEFIKKIFRQKNAGRHRKVQEELSCMRILPATRLDDCKREKMKVGPSSTINVKHNTYSVNSRLIGEQIEVRIYADHLEIWYGQNKQETIPRLRGESKHRINYRHIISWLVRKPGAFENYRYRDDLFPSSYFRIAYDSLKEKHCQQVASKEYLRILYLAATESETKVECVLKDLFSERKEINAVTVESLIKTKDIRPTIPDIQIKAIDLSIYNALCEVREEVYSYA